MENSICRTSGVSRDLRTDIDLELLKSNQVPAKHYAGTVNWNANDVSKIIFIMTPRQTNSKKKVAMKEFVLARYSSYVGGIDLPCPKCYTFVSL
jgi:hypothetical protein